MLPGRAFRILMDIALFEVTTAYFGYIRYNNKGNMFKRTSDTTACIKAFVKNDWIWVDVVFRPQDLFKRGVHEWKECNPKLVK